MAAPAAAVTVVVPLSVLAPGFAPMVMVMESVAPVPVVTTLPPESSTLTTTAGVIGKPCDSLVGWTSTRSADAVPAVMLKVVLVAVVRPELVAESV